MFRGANQFANQWTLGTFTWKIFGSSLMSLIPLAAVSPFKFGLDFDVLHITH